jgi:hypothetical protein
VALGAGVRVLDSETDGDRVKDRDRLGETRCVAEPVDVPLWERVPEAVVVCDSEGDDVWLCDALPEPEEDPEVEGDWVSLADCD